MMFDGINLVGVALAAVASFAFGALWYGLLRRTWQRAARMSADAARPGAITMLVTFAAELLMAFIFAGVIYHAGGLSVKSGLISAGMIWTGFFLTSLVVSHRHQKTSPLLLLIDGGHWLGVLLIQGAVIGLVG